MAAIKEETVAVWNGKINLRVKVAGAGSPIVYFHAAGGLRWDPFLDRLAERHRVYAPEHPGTTLEDPYAIHEVHSLWELVLVYEELIRALGVERPVAVGQSFGGMLALELAASYPSLFDRVVSLAPVGLWRDEHPVVNWPAVPPEEVPQLLFHNAHSDAAQQLFNPGDPEAAREALVRYIWSVGCTAKWCWPIPDRGLERRLFRVQCPTLIIWGRQDRLVPVSYANLFGQLIRQSRVEVLDDCGHVPQADKLEETLGLVLAFIDEA